MQALDEEVVAWPALDADDEDRFSGDLAFSFRMQFPDAWEDLTHPHTMTDPAFTMRARITTTREDFPAHVDELSVTGIALYGLHQRGFAESIGLSSVSPDFNGRSPVGTWTLELEVTDTLRDWCRRGEMLDLVLVIGVDGVVSNWTMS